LRGLGYDEIVNLSGRGDAAQHAADTVAVELKGDNVAPLL
jgi:hypothetical protein